MSEAKENFHNQNALDLDIKQKKKHVNFSIININNYL